MHPLFVLWTFLSGRLGALYAWQNAHTDTSRSVHDRDLNRAAGSSTVCFPSVSPPTERFSFLSSRRMTPHCGRFHK
ncbi:hypothetical protein EDB83DRAFT_2363358 [Lactarius deliciosus]|nr:hypothetical protein EDB83DRAFT_2363358 [Lactarius deliciosus]